MKWRKRSCRGHRRQGRPSHEGRGLKFIHPITLFDAAPASSLSRGTWIEIFCQRCQCWQTGGRPSHEGRGLKSNGIKTRHGPYGSSLSRGTWIEIITPSARLIFGLSSLSRGTWIEILYAWLYWSFVPRRPSHEGRGLKYDIRCNVQNISGRPSHEGRGLKLALGAAHSCPPGSSLSRGTWIEI